MNGWGWLGLVIHVVFARARLGRNDLGVRAVAQRSARSAERGRLSSRSTAAAT